MPYPFEHVNTPFDKNKFNFNKIKDEEVITSNINSYLLWSTFRLFFP